MKFATLVPANNLEEGGKLVAAGLGFFGDVAWPAIKGWAAPKEVQEVLPSAVRKVKTKVSVRPAMLASHSDESDDEAGSAGTAVDDDLAGVPVEERAPVADSAFNGFFTLPAPDDDHVDLASSFTIESAFVNFLRTVRCSLGPFLFPAVPLSAYSRVAHLGDTCMLPTPASTYAATSRRGIAPSTRVMLLLRLA
jgi:hypothetical protein